MEEQLTGNFEPCAARRLAGGVVGLDAVEGGVRRLHVGQGERVDAVRGGQLNVLHVIGQLNVTTGPGRRQFYR